MSGVREIESVIYRIDDGIYRLNDVDGDERAEMVRQFADALGVPATVWGPADLVARSTDWTDDEMTEAEVAPHRERAAKAYEMLPRLMQKADQDYSVVDWALALAESEGK